ncbi:RNA polymerase sigma factor [Vulgatibacter sp.]|uniref:RNA polymerase sigma factor n=1 Tax=Vulgatibacter sp. TaxID=1971226 RepID=UPI0035652AF9
MNPNPPAARAAIPGPDDETIVRRVLAGEVDLFEILMRRHNQRIYRAVRSILRDENEVEEVMQQAYVSAFEHLAQFQGSARLSTWLTRIAVHEAFGWLRKGRRLVAIDGGAEMEPAQGASPEQRAADREMVGWLEAAIDELPEGYRTVFVLREVEALSTAEAAEALELSEDAVKQRLHRAKAMLREQLAARMEANASGAFLFEAPRCNRVVAGVLARIHAGR